MCEHHDNRKQQFWNEVCEPNGCGFGQADLADGHEPSYSGDENAKRQEIDKGSCCLTVRAAQKQITPVPKYTPAMKRCTLSSRGVVSGCPKYICKVPPNMPIAAKMNKHI